MALLKTRKLKTSTSRSRTRSIEKLESQINRVSQPNPSSENTRTYRPSPSNSRDIEAPGTYAANQEQHSIIKASLILRSS